MNTNKIFSAIALLLLILPCTTYAQSRQLDPSCAANLKYNIASTIEYVDSTVAELDSNSSDPKLKRVYETGIAMEEGLDGLKNGARLFSDDEVCALQALCSDSITEALWECQ